MYIARMITDNTRFSDWCISGSCPFGLDSAELDLFSEVIDFDENPRTLKRRVYNRWHGYFVRVLIFRDSTLVSWRYMAFGKRWSKWFEKQEISL